jgi:hypothetical protein
MKIINLSKDSLTGWNLLLLFSSLSCYLTPLFPSSPSYGISCNNDSVLRSVFYKYLHPKEVFISEGVLVPDIARKKVRRRLESG